VVVDDFDLVSVALAKLKTNTPALVDRHCPLPSAIALKLVQSDTLQRAEIVERFGNVQCQQQIDGGIEIQPAKLVRPLAVPDFASRRIPPSWR